MKLTWPEKVVTLVVAVVLFGCALVAEYCTSVLDRIGERHRGDDERQEQAGLVAEVEQYLAEAREE